MHVIVPAVLFILLNGSGVKYKLMSFRDACCSAVKRHFPPSWFHRFYFLHICHT